jgi:hypothetical protein
LHMYVTTLNLLHMNKYVLFILRNVGQLTVTGNSYPIQMCLYRAGLAPSTVLDCSPYLEPSCFPKLLLWECSPRAGRNVATATAQRTSKQRTVNIHFRRTRTIIIPSLIFYLFSEPFNSSA